MNIDIGKLTEAEEYDLLVAILGETTPDKLLAAIKRAYGRTDIEEISAALEDHVSKYLYQHTRGGD